MSFDGYVPSTSLGYISFVSQYLNGISGRFYVGKNSVNTNVSLKIDGNNHYDGINLSNKNLLDGWYLWVVEKSGNDYTITINDTEALSFTDTTAINDTTNTYLGLMDTVISESYIDNVLFFNKTYSYSEVDNFIEDNNLRIEQTPYLTIEYPVSFQFFQRDVSSETGDVLLKGKVNETSNLYIKINEGNWQLVESNIENNFETSFNMPQGTYNISLKTDSNEEIKILYVSVGDIYLLMGQSNMDGRAITKNNFNNSSGIYGSMFQQKNRCEYHITSNQVEGSWKIADDPTGNGNAGGCYDFGAQWVIALNSLIPKHQVPIAWIPGSYGGTPISLWDGKGNVHYDRALELTNQATLNNNNIRGVLWHQGETDASNSYANYYSGLEKLYGNLTEDLTFDKFMIAPVARGDDHYYNGLSAGPQKAQYDFIDNNEEVVFGGESYDILQSVDALHYKTDLEIETFAERWINTISKEFYNDNNIKSPRITKFSLYNSTTLILRSTLDLEISYYDNTPASKVYGIKISDGVTTLDEDNYTSEIKEAGVYIYLDSEIDESYKISYANINDTYNLPALRDTSNNLPILRIYNESIVFLTNQEICEEIEDNYWHEDSCVTQLPIESQTCNSISEQVYESFNLGIVALIILVAALIIGILMSAFGGSGIDATAIGATISMIIVSAILFVIGVAVFGMISGAIC